MALGRISGPLLKANLRREGVDLAFETDLLYLSVSDPDPAKWRVGIKNASPAYDLDISGTAQATSLRSSNLVVDEVVVSGNTITTNLGDLKLSVVNSSNNVRIASNVIPDEDNVYSFGSTSYKWQSGYFDNLTLVSSLTSGNIVVSGNTISSTTGSIILNPADTNILDIQTTAVISEDLQINGGNLTTSATSFNLLNTTATTINFGSAATAVNIGATTGTLTLRNATVVGASATQTLWDTTATTINFGGAATALTMGATTGTLTLRNPTIVGSSATQSLWDTTATTINFGGTATALTMGATTGTLTLRNATVVGSNATQNLWNTTATTINFGGAATALTVGATTGTLTLRNATVVGSNAVQSLWDTTATTINFGGAATAVNIGAITGTTTVRNTLDVNGDLIVDGGDLTTSATTFNILPTTATTVNLGGAATAVNIGSSSGTTTVNNNFVVSGQALVSGQLTLSSANITDLSQGRVVIAGTNGELEDSANLTFINSKLTVTGDQDVTGMLRLVSTTALKLPSGTDSDKLLFAPETGQIRFNTTLNQFEGYQGSVWSSLGGVRSADGLTYITPELTPGASDDILRFYNNGSLSVTITPTEFSILSPITSTKILSTTDSTSSTSGALVVSGGVGISGNLNIGSALDVSADATVDGNLLVGGNLTVNGTITSINSTVMTVDDKNIELGSVATPTDATADGGGITLKGASDKTINWVALTGAWTSSEHFNLALNKTYKINAVDVLTASAVLGSATTASVATSATTLTLGATTGSLTVRNTTTNLKNLSVSGTSSITGDLTVGSGFTVTALNGNTSISGQLSVNNNAIVTGTLDVSSATTLSSTLAVTGQITANSSLVVVGSATPATEYFKVTNGTADTFVVDSATGNTVISGTLTVNNNALVNNITASSGTFSGQVTSTVATGSSPFVVASTTKVNNLNADLLDGYDTSTSSVANTVAVRTATGGISVSAVNVTGTTGTTVLKSESTASGTLTLPSATDTLVGKNTVDTLTNKTINLTNNTLTGTIAQFNDALSNADFATLAGTETLTNKTINLTNNTLTGTIAQFNAALSNADFATLAGTETLTNKTLTNPVINSAGGTLVLPQASVPGQVAEGSIVWDTDNDLLTVGTGTVRKTMVDLDSTQTLTNKTLISPIITGISPTITLTGDITGSGTLVDLGSVTISTTIEPNSVALGTDTTGNYIATITGTANQITVTGSGVETAAVTLSLPQNIHTGATPTFAGATLDAIQIGVTSATEINTVTGNLTIDSAGGTVTVDDDLIVSGNLLVQGTTTTVDSIVTTIVDPVVEIGGSDNGGPALSDDGKDRGIKFNWFDITSKSGFFGYDVSTGYFTVIPEATFNNDTVSGTPGVILASTFRGNLIADTATVSDGLLVIGDVTLTPGSAKTLKIAPVAVGTIDNVNIGQTTPGTGAFTTLTASGTLTVSNTTNSSSKDTGAVIVEGGVGVEKNLNVGGNAAVTGTLAVTGAVTFTEKLAVSSGGTGATTFVENGILYGNGQGPIKQTAVSSFSGENTTTSNGILTTTIDSVPVWTDVIDGGVF